MSDAILLDEPAIESVPVDIPAENLATATEKLAALRFLIIVTARSESLDSANSKRRKQIRRELARLRTDYFNKIDEIAMNHGVQEAMDAKRDVEHRVMVPRNVVPPTRTPEAEEAWF